MIRTLRAHAVRLGRPRLLLAMAGFTVLYSVVATALAVATAEPASRTPLGGLTVETLTEPGAGTAATVWVAGFAAVFVLAVVTAFVAGDFSRGTFRAAALQQPSRMALVGGAYVAVIAVIAGLLAVAMTTGWVTARLVAPGQGIDVAEWDLASSLSNGVADWGRVLLTLSGWALLGTMLGTLVRSVPVALAIGVVWAGPVENVVGEDWTPGRQWFPGLLLRSLLGSNPDVTTLRASIVLAAYATAAATAIWYGVTRRDVTA